jgi:hypothetical protein
MAMKNIASGPQSAPAEQAPVKDGYVRIMIASDGSEAGNSDVFASDGQGGQVLIQRDKVVEVKVGVYNTLMEAAYEHFQTNSEGGIISSRKVPRFNVQVVM